MDTERANKLTVEARQAIKRNAFQEARTLALQAKQLWSEEGRHEEERQHNRAYHLHIHAATLWTIAFIRAVLPIAELKLNL